MCVYVCVCVCAHARKDFVFLRGNYVSHGTQRKVDGKICWTSTSRQRQASIVQVCLCVQETWLCGMRGTAMFDGAGNVVEA